MGRLELRGTIWDDDFDHSAAGLLTVQTSGFTKVGPLAGGRRRQAMGSIKNQELRVRRWRLTGLEIVSGMAAGRWRRADRTPREAAPTDQSRTLAGCCRQ